MPINKLALIRFRTLDACLRNRHRKWTLDNLIDHVSEALYEYEGISKGVSRRTIQSDLQLMRSNKLGYNAPIIVIEKKYYTYEDAEYSITNIPLTDQDLNTLDEVVNILSQFKGFSHFNELSGMINRLEDKVNSVKTKSTPVIDFEKNESLKGLEHLDILFHTIVDKRPIAINYQSFNARTPGILNFHPYLLKEFRNRWFILGWCSNKKCVMNLALDRIVAIDVLKEKLIPNTFFDARTYFDEIIGVTRNNNQRPQNIIFYANKKNAPYIITKPFHRSQQIKKETETGIIFSINVIMNLELERDLLGFGEAIKVLSPKHLAQRIKGRLTKAISNYDDEGVSMQNF